MTDEYFDIRSVPTAKEARGPLGESEEIETREGTVVADVGDFVVRESDGNEYPISPEKFSEYYEIVDDENVGQRVLSISNELIQLADSELKGEPEWVEAPLRLHGQQLGGLALAYPSVNKDELDVKIDWGDDDD
jgi:hypothetical protein